MSDPSAPFACHYTPELPERLHGLGCSLLVSTYQAGKLLTISSDGERIVQLPRTFEEPMGVAVEGDRLAVATKHAVVVLQNEPRLAAGYPKQPETYDAIFAPRAVHFTGGLAVHDMVWTERGLLGVNTLFSCLFELDPQFSFRPVWTPPFVSQLAPEDRCHLNGLALEHGKPRFVTALGASDHAGGWREKKERGGVLLDVPSGEIVLDGLPMPHSPRLHEGTLYALLAATGEVIVVDLERGTYDVVQRVDGFARGLAVHGDFLFVGTSRIRKDHTFGDLGLAGRREAFCGISVLQRSTGALVGELRYLQSCEEIYDVHVLPRLRRPNVLGLHDETHQNALTTPDQTFWAQPRPRLA